MTDETQRRILAAALELFSEHGFSGTCTKAIAEAADVNEVTLFRLFGSKKGLYQETFRRFMVRPDPGVLLLGLNGDIHADIKKIAGAIVVLIEQNDRLIRMNVKDIKNFPEIDAELSRHPEALIAIVAGYFESLAERATLCDTPERLARHFVTMLFGTALYFIAQKEFCQGYSLLDCVTQYADIFSRGILVSDA
jgi:TetR/AcrR family transcriptional regulator, mexJK operon transcriptional repressor